METGERHVSFDKARKTYNKEMRMRERVRVCGKGQIA